MANTCEITGKKKLRGHRVSHANNKTIHYQRASSEKRRFFIPELGVHVRINVSKAGLRTLDKFGGLSRFVVKSLPEKLSPSLRRLRKVLVKHGLH